jgi:acyl-CoA thioester hydrolase
MFKTIIEPRVSETDGVGHINNTTIPVWLEAGRNQVFRIFMPEPSFEKWNVIVVNVNVDYVAQIYYGINAEVHTHVQKLGNSSFVLYEEIYQEEKLCVKATATYVYFNQEQGRPEPIPSHFREELAKHIYSQQSN